LVIWAIDLSFFYVSSLKKVVDDKIPIYIENGKIIIESETTIETCIGKL
jgi:hypothetical protein